MSKFEWQGFIGGYDSFAVSKEKFTLSEAIEIAMREMSIPRDDKGYLAYGHCFCRYRYGRLEDGETTSGWWLEYTSYPRSCPCWCFHTSSTEDEKFNMGYTYIKIKELKKNIEKV